MNHGNRTALKCQKRAAGRRQQGVRGDFFANEQVFMKEGEFGTRQPVTDAGFCSKVE
jgi:hypothetical protein